MLKICIVYVFLYLLGTLSVYSNIDSVRVYYTNVNNAELKIVDSNYVEALNCYKKAFVYKQANAEDIANAFQASLLLKDKVSSKFFLEQLAIKGLPPKFFKDNTQFIAFDIDSIFYQEISLNYDSLYLVSQKLYKSFGESFQRFYDEDQRVRNLSVDDKANHGRSFDMENEKALLKYIDSTSFPTFESVGFWGTFGKSHFMNGVVWLLAWHRRPEQSILEDIILSQVLKGNYVPELYAGILDGRRNDIYGNQLVHIGISELSEIEIKQLNSKREEIYLEPIEDYIRKSKFQFTDERFMLVNDFYLGFFKAIDKLKSEKQ